MKVSFIIVNYNVTECLRNCLQSIEKYAAEISHEVIVIDNASPDSSWKTLIKEFPNVKFIENTANEGFSKANNKAVKTAAGEYLYFLNPDTELEGFYLNELLNFAESTENFGSLGLRMHDEDGNFLPESKRSVPDISSSFEKFFINFKENRKKSYYRDDIPENAVAEVEVLTGANLLVKKDIYLKIGGFDERYFMYGEDIDLCYTLMNSGYKNFYYGKYSILHHKGKSTVKDSKYLERFYGAMQIFLDKYYKKEKPLQHKILSAGLRLKKRLEYMKK